MLMDDEFEEEEEESRLQKLYERMNLSTVFHKFIESKLFRSFEVFCGGEGLFGVSRGGFRAYATFVAEIYEQGGNLTEVVKKFISEDENVYVKAIAAGKEIPACIRESAEKELRTFSEFAALTPADFAESLEVYEDEIPAFESYKEDMVGFYRNRLENLGKYGYGIFSASGMFRLTDDKKIEAIVSADKISMEQFIGYEAEREKIVANTRAFVQGRPAANALLCGDAGTGKSSTVKAVANAFFDEGVRLIELRKDQLRYLPLVMASISSNPLKFIIFIDDLSFNQNNDDFSMLKAALEGSASATADNAVIYATSNRRHIVKESFGDREGDDIHRNDSMQETLSLSERFGLTVLFSKPDKKLYLKIVKTLAKRYGLNADEKGLEEQAEAFAIRKGNRSARCAEQFIDSLR